MWRGQTGMNDNGGGENNLKCCGHSNGRACKRKWPRRKMSAFAVALCVKPESSVKAVKVL